MSRSPVKHRSPQARLLPIRGRRAAFAEHSLVALRAGVKLADGRLLASGAVGTVVGVWRGGAAYEVEFAEPLQAVVTVEASDLVKAIA